MPAPLHLCLCITLGVAAITGAVACSTPCADLAERICNCEPTEADQQACLRRVEAQAAGIALDNEDEEGCNYILTCDICNCDRLELGELNSCGLSLPKPTLDECKAGREADQEAQQN